MAYFSYHAVAKNLILGGHLVAFKVFESYGSISPALVLFFDNHRPMPIRQSHWSEYFAILDTKS